MEMTTEVAKKRSVFARFFGIVADPKAYAAIAYMLFALVTGTAYFSLAVTGVSLSLGLAILIIGIPVALGVLALVRGVAFAEGRLIEALLGEKMPAKPKPEAVEGSIVQRVRYWLKDSRTWTSLMYMIAQLPLGVLYFTFVTFWIALAAYLMVWPVLQVVFGMQIPYFDTTFQIAGWALPLVAATGALVLIVFMHAAKGIGRLHANYAKSFLVGEQK